MGSHGKLPRKYSDEIWHLEDILDTRVVEASSDDTSLLSALKHDLFCQYIESTLFDVFYDMIRNIAVIQIGFPLQRLQILDDIFVDLMCAVGVP